MRAGITVTNIMADGTICRTKEELAEYGRRAEFPDLAKKLMLNFIEAGAALNKREMQEQLHT